MLPKQIDRTDSAGRIVDLIIRNGPMPRPELSLTTGLSPATVTNIVKDLLDKGVILEKGKYESALGRKARLLEFNGRFGFFVGMRLDSCALTELYLSDMLGELIEKRRLNINLIIDESNKIEDLIGSITENIRELINSANPVCKKKIHAVGISVPSITKSDESIYSPLYHWNDIPIKAVIENTFGLPCYVENITRIKAIYEMRFINSAEDRNVIYLALSPGVGMVNFYDSKMIRGKHSIAGEAGHMSINKDGAECYCGNRGCFEVYCGENNILARARALVRSDQSPILAGIIEGDLNRLDIGSLYTAQQLGDMKVHELLTEVGNSLGCALVSIINCYDPDRLILSGDLIEKGDLVLNYATEEMRKRAFDGYLRDIAIEKARLKSDEFFKGISAFILSRSIDSIIKTGAAKKR